MKYVIWNLLLQEVYFFPKLRGFALQPGGEKKSVTGEKINASLG